MDIRVVSVDNLIENAFKPHIVHDYCSKCPNYSMHFSCPSHNFSIPAFLANYSHVMIISHRLDARLDEYSYYRDLIDPLLMAHESKFTGQALLAGVCRNCDFCFEDGAQICHNPQLLRYSLESLGFDIARLLQVYFKQELDFDERRLQLVYGMLLKSAPDQIALMEFKGELNELTD